MTITIQLYHRIINNKLFIYCTHNNGGATMTMAKALSKFGDAAMKGNIETEKFEETQRDNIGKWVERHLKSITEGPDSSHINRVIYSSDVNLGRSGQYVYPQFLMDTTLAKAVAPVPIEKILFSSEKNIVADAQTKIEDATVVETIEMLKILKGRADILQSSQIIFNGGGLFANPQAPVDNQAPDADPGAKDALRL